MRRACVVALLLIGTACVHFRSDLTGTVLEYEPFTTKWSPLPAATVTVECSVGQFHGTKKIKDLTYISDAQGRYTIPGLDLLRCQFIDVSLAKEGFVDAVQVYRGFNVAFEHVDAKLFLVKKDNITIVKLERAELLSHGLMSNRPLDKFKEAYGNFYDGTLIAQTDSERAFVSRSYCQRLQALLDAMTSEQRATIGNERFSVPSNLLMLPVDPSLILTWCSAPA
jgi:hypothetical protein